MQLHLTKQFPLVRNVLQRNAEGRCVRALCGGQDESDGNVLFVLRGRRAIERDGQRRVQAASQRAPVIGGNPRSDGPSTLPLH